VSDTFSVSENWGPDNWGRTALSCLLSMGYV